MGTVAVIILVLTGLQALVALAKDGTDLERRLEAFLKKKSQSPFFTLKP